MRFVKNIVLLISLNDLLNYCVIPKLGSFQHTRIPFYDLVLDSHSLLLTDFFPFHALLSLSVPTGVVSKRKETFWIYSNLLFLGVKYAFCKV